MINRICILEPIIEGINDIYEDVYVILISLGHVVYYAEDEENDEEELGWIVAWYVYFYDLQWGF